MGLKLKALGLGLIAAFAMGMVSVMGASADTGGHFTSGTTHTAIVGEDGSPHPEFTVNGEGLFCEGGNYSGTLSENTATSLTVTVEHYWCSHNLGSAIVYMNSCDYIFTVSENESSDNTTHLDCLGSAGPELKINGPFGTCLITVTPDQTPSGGVSYTHGTSWGKGDITVDFTLSGLHMIFDGGVFACGVSNGATREGELHGEITLEGRKESIAGEPVDIAAT